MSQLQLICSTARCLLDVLYFQVIATTLPTILKPRHSHLHIQGPMGLESFVMNESIVLAQTMVHRRCIFAIIADSSVSRLQSCTFSDDCGTEYLLKLAVWKLTMSNSSGDYELNPPAWHLSVARPHSTLMLRMTGLDTLTHSGSHLAIGLNTLTNPDAAKHMHATPRTWSRCIQYIDQVCLYWSTVGPPGHKAINCNVKHT